MRRKKRRVALTAAIMTVIAIFAVAGANETFAEGKATITVPQSVYSVANTAKPFNLNAKCANSLTYSSSKPAVASVSPKGIVTPKKPGKTTVSIIDRTNPNNGGTVTVVVSKYKKPNGKMAESMGNFDGKSGDRKGIESGIYKYQYNRGVNYRRYNFIIRCTDPVVADKAALAAKYIVNNKNFGYYTRGPKSQANVYARASIYKACVKATGKNPSKAQLKKIKHVRKKANTSCTPTLLAGYWLYYDMNTKVKLRWIGKYGHRKYNYYCGAPNVEAHQLEKCIRQVNREYRAKGMLEPFQIIYVPASKRASTFKPSRIKKKLKRGDILCSCTNPWGNGHTVMLQ